MACTVLAVPLFSVEARISSANLADVEPAVRRIIGSAGTVTRTGGDLIVRGRLEGLSARDLNRSLLSELRSIERRTRIRSEWIGEGGRERFFDYVPKGKRPVTDPDGSVPGKR